MGRTSGGVTRNLVLFVLEVLAQRDKGKILETELLATCLYEVVTSSALKFDEHMKEPITHELFARMSTADQTFIKSKLTKAQTDAILEHYGRKTKKDD